MIDNHIISKTCQWNNCFIENNQELLLHVDLADFKLQEQPEENLIQCSGFSRTWYNGPYTMAAKPIKSLELALCMLLVLVCKSNMTLWHKIRLLLNAQFWCISKF